MTKLHAFRWLCLFMLAFAIELAAQSPVGKWNFDDADNLLKAEIGSNLDLEGSAVAIPGPADNNGAVRVDVGSHFIMNHGIEGNGGGVKVNNWSLLIDFRVAQLDIWHTFYQINPTNEDDGECFKNTSGHIGVWVTGYSEMAIEVDQWYRLILSVECGYAHNYFLDGELLHEGTPQEVDGRFALEQILLLFADENEEDGEIDVAQVAIWDYPLNDGEAYNLGNVEKEVTAIDEMDRDGIHGYKLEQNYPNPFNPITTINYQIPQDNEVELTVYNLVGKKITTLVSEHQAAGSYAVNWNAGDFPTGVYLYYLRAGNYVESRKMLLVK
ncbi:MAG: T9SS C-terminal target domain-containing protein [Calditrichaeota bacterium]|nr:MAG: T9SS C-terminal target domain-containing protein [Calditrichota bacterium]